MEGTWKGLFSPMSAIGSVNKTIGESAEVNARTRCMRCFKTPHQLWPGSLALKGDNRPFFFEDGNVTGSRYKRMLWYFLLPRLRDYPRSMIFQQDGASAQC